MSRIISFLIILFFPLYIIAQEQEMIFDVEGQQISKADVFDLLIKRYPGEVNEVIRELIVRSIIKIEIEKENVDIAKDEIIAKVLEEIEDTKKKIKEELGKTWDEYLESKSLTERNIKRDLFIQWKYSLSLQQLVRLFELRQKHLEIRHIMVDTKAKAEELINKVKQGADFSVLVEQNSLAKTTNKNGGKITAFEGELPEDMEKVIWNMPAGLIHKPVLSGVADYHVIEIVKIHKSTAKAGWYTLKDAISQSLKDKPISPRDFGRWLNYMKKIHKITQKLE